EDHALVVIGLDDDGLAVEGEIGIGVIGAVEVEADDVVVVGEEGGLVGGGGGGGFGDAVEANRIGVEAMDEEGGDGGQADQPPGAALAGNDQCDESDAKEDGEDDEGPLVLS